MLFSFYFVTRTIPSRGLLILQPKVVSSTFTRNAADAAQKIPIKISNEITARKALTNVRTVIKFISRARDASQFSHTQEKFAQARGGLHHKAGLAMFASARALATTLSLPPPWTRTTPPTHS